MPNKALRVTCPSCDKEYTTRCGLKKHLLKEHRLVFIENSDLTKKLTDAEYQDAMSRRWKGQQHRERAVVPVLPAQRKTTTQSDPRVFR